MNGQVDMLKLVEEEDMVAQGLYTLALMYEGRSPDPFYWKAVVIFSHRFFALEAIEEGMSVLKLVPTEYLRGAEMRQQMEEDVGYAELAKRIADRVIMAGKAMPSIEMGDVKMPVTNTIGKA